MQFRESRLSPQPWPWMGPRVLIEDPDEAEAEALVAALREAGYAVAVCSGPRHGERCPLASEDDCVTALGADAVVSRLGLETAEGREALRALRARVPRSRILVEAGADAVARWPELVDGCEVVAAPAAPEQLVERVRGLLEQEAGDVA